MKYSIFLVILALPAIYGTTISRRISPSQDEMTQSVERGKEVYSTQCMSCHQPNGEGLSGVYPPLAGSDHLTKDQEKSISIILKGQDEEITVKGTKYSVPMPSMNTQTDQQIADVLNYMGHSWGNQFNAVTPALVKSKRD
jgi:mono/diheme cytochrome c family protein